jgi:hypothetical protein
MSGALGFSRPLKAIEGALIDMSVELAAARRGAD